MDKMTNKIVDYCRTSRIAQEMTQQDLALKSGVSKNTIARFEKGQDVSMKTWLSMLCALGFSDSLMAVLSLSPVKNVNQFHRLASGALDKRRRVRPNKKIKHEKD